MLTLKTLKEMAPHTIFSGGSTVDSPGGINFTGSDQPLRWIAVRGGIHDWAIYAHTTDKTDDWIKQQGNKVYNDSTVRRLVPCDDEAFGMYRH